MTVDELANKLGCFLRFLEKLMRENGLPVEGSTETGLTVRGHNVTALFTSAITLRYNKGFSVDDYSIVGAFLDDHWNVLREPPKPLNWDTKKKLGPLDLHVDWAQVGAQAARNEAVQRIIHRPARAANLRDAIEG